MTYEKRGEGRTGEIEAREIRFIEDANLIEREDVFGVVLEWLTGGREEKSGHRRQEEECQEMGVDTCENVE